MYGSEQINILNIITREEKKRRRKKKIPLKRKPNKREPTSSKQLPHTEHIIMVFITSTNTHGIASITQTLRVVNI